jgi:ABC-type bacteriocin/lantibiotic exporter with double-glycine peptidase domain
LFENFNGYWKDNFDSPSLSNINLFFQKGVFYGITGRVGSGKSGLLGVILRELPYFNGKF